LPVVGKCAICGTEGELSFEHIPPRAAYNKRPLLAQSPLVSLKAGTVLPLGPGSVRQGGAGVYTLCHGCNNRTGSWYGRPYVDFVHVWAEIASRLPIRHTACRFARIRPLRVFKQIVSMFLSANSGGFGEKQDDLARFILDKESREFPSGLGIYGFVTTSRLRRMSPITARADLFAGKVYAFSEIAFPPLGFVMTSNSSPPDFLLCSMNHLADYRYNDDIAVPVCLAKLEVNSWMQADYRSLEEIRRETEKNAASSQRRSANRHGSPLDTPD
jgi:hypothetical protein